MEAVLRTHMKMLAALASFSSTKALAFVYAFLFAFLLRRSKAGRWEIESEKTLRSIAGKVKANRLSFSA